MMTIFTTTSSTLPTLSSKKRMVSMILFGSHTTRTCGEYPTTATTTTTTCSSRSIHGHQRLYHNHAHQFRSLSSTVVVKTTKVSSWRSCSSFIQNTSSLEEPQLALAYDRIDTEDDPEDDGDRYDDRALCSTKHHYHQYASNDGHPTNTTTTGNNNNNNNNNITTTTSATTATSTTPSGSTNHGGGGGGGSRRHRCPKCGTFVTFQHSDFDIANHNSSHNGSSTTFYCAHCSGYFLLQHPSAALLSGTRSAPVESNHPTTTTTSINELSSSSPPQQRIILRVNHNGGGGGLPPPPPDSSTMPPPPPPLLNTIPTPYEIVQGLNEYVIGQRNVKIALSVGIYNHYKRLFINNQSMMTQAASTPTSVDETSQRPPSSQRPSSSSSSFIIVRHPDRSTNGNQMDPNDLNHDSTIQFTDPNQSPQQNGIPHQSSNTNHESTMNQTLADYTNHLTQFGTTTNTTKKGNPTSTTTTSSSSSSSSSNNSSGDIDDTMNQNNIKYNGRDHAMDDTDDTIEIDKSNILLLGPTGSGKTLLVRTLAKLIQVPLVITDATCLTQAGYVGEDVESILFKLYIESNHDIHKTQRGIIYIDEVDKIRKSGGPNISISRDVSGEGVQHALLKIVEGNVINVPKEPGRKNPRGDFLQIDTTNILFIAGGAFSGLEHIINRRMDAASIGFNANMKKMNMDTNVKVQGRYFDQAIPKDLVEYGMIPEFVGRFPVITTTKGLDLNNLVEILTKPKNSIMKQYTKLFHMDDVQFHITDDALLEIAKTAYTRGTGARGLRSITDAVLMDTQYIVPSYHHNNKNIHTVYVDGAAVRKERPIILIHDPHLTVDMYESYLLEGRAYTSISGVIPVSIDEFESTLQQQQGDEETNVGTTAETSPLEEVAA